MKRIVTLWVWVVAFITLPAVADSDLHNDWQALVTKHVHAVNEGQSSAVDYVGMQSDRNTLKGYLSRLAKVNKSQFDTWSYNQQLAFLINAYNAWSVEFILTQYPDLDSIKDLGSLFSSPWSKDIVTLFAKKYSLDDLEHTLIRGDKRFNEPRIHFAVNCASIGCPALLDEAYRGEQLERQLDLQTRRFLSDKSRNYAKGNELYLPPIFKWYGEDFEQGGQTLQGFLSNYSHELGLSDVQTQALKNNKMSISYTHYNWDLNDLQR